MAASALLAMLGCGCSMAGRQATPGAPREDLPAGCEARRAQVGDVDLRYLVAGKGDAVVLMHGYAQTSHMWLPLIEVLSRDHLVIAPDLRGAGGSSKPDSGYDKKTMAADVHALVRSLGIERAAIVGHDIGLMVAYAYAAQFPAATERVVLMDAFLPGIGEWKDVWLMRDLWHFHFHGEVPLALVAGRERIYLEHFWNDFAADRSRSVSEEDRVFYAAAYAQPGAMRAGFEYFRAFEQDAKDFAAMARHPVTMPVLVLTGEKASGPVLVTQTRLVANDVRGEVVPGVGHWLMDEARESIVPRIVAFVAESGPARRPTGAGAPERSPVSSSTAQ